MHEPPDARFTSVRITISTLNLIVGIFILLRMPVKQFGSLRLILAALPSLLVAGFAFKLSPRPDHWPLHAQILFAAGGIVASCSFLFLGKSFSILPALRDIVVKGPYRFIRHPAYLGELAMVLACGLAEPKLLTLAPFLIGVPLIVVRILAEEKLLSSDDGYCEYRRKVRFRLIPLVW